MMPKNADGQMAFKLYTSKYTCPITQILVLKRIVNFTIRIVGIKTTKYSINLFPKAIDKKVSGKTTYYQRNHR